MRIVITIVIIEGVAITIRKKSEGSLHERDISIIIAAKAIRTQPIRAKSPAYLFRKITKVETMKMEPGAHTARTSYYYT